MTVSLRTKAGCLILLVVLISTGIGFALGLVASKAFQKRKEDPIFWKQTALKRLEKLQPDEGQQKKFEAVTERATGDLAALRQRGIEDVWGIIHAAAKEIEADLTPEQQKKFEEIRPRPPKAVAK